MFGSTVWIPSGFLTVLMPAKTFSLPNQRNPDFELDSIQVQIGVTMTPKHLCSRRQTGRTPVHLINSDEHNSLEASGMVDALTSHTVSPEFVSIQTI